MTNEELIQLAIERNEIDFLFKITKIIAESDSIGEGYTYCKEYTIEYFDEAIKHKDRWGYLFIAGLPIYEEYIKQVEITS